MNDSRISRRTKKNTLQVRKKWGKKRVYLNGAEIHWDNSSPVTIDVHRSSHVVHHGGMSNSLPDDGPPTITITLTVDEFKD